MITELLLLGSFLSSPAVDHGAVTDTLRVEVGSPEVDGRIFPVHRARNRVYLEGSTEPSVTWTNELTLGDSVGIPVMRWVTRGEPGPAATGGQRWELLQTYHARTLGLLGYSSTSGSGAYMRLTLDGNRLRGVKRGPGEDAVEEPVDRTLDRLGFMASASDLVPMAVGLRAGSVIVAPVWGPNMPAPEDRVFTVLDQETVSVEGADVLAWKVEERFAETGDLHATWWLTEESPYMVLAEVVLSNGQVQRITGVALPQQEDAAAGIARSASSFSRALEAGDAAGMAAQYTDDATLIPPNGRLFTGREAILEFWTPRGSAFRTLEHRLTTDRLEVSGDVATEVGTWYQRGQLGDQEPTESSGRYLVVWRRQADGEWKMQFDAWTRPFEAPPEE